MKNIKLLVGFLLVSITTAHGMKEMVPYVPSPWYSLLTDIKTGIVAGSTVVDQKSLGCVNKDLAFLASKANFTEMITHFPCIMDRDNHLEFMIKYSLKRDVQAQNIMKLLIKNAQFCNHTDALDITPYFFPAITDAESLTCTLEVGNLKHKPENLYLIIPACALVYKENPENKTLSKIVIPEIMDIYGGYQSAIDRYKERYRQEEDVITTHLHIAVEQGHTAIAELFIMQNPNLLYQTDAHGMIPLAIAAQQGNLDIIKLLQKWNKRSTINQKIDIPFEKSPCFFAAQAGNTECLQQLLTHDIFVNSFAAKPLHIATANNHIQTIEMLLADPNTDINAKNESGHTTMHIAIIAQISHDINAIPLLQLLLAKDALLNDKDITGCSPLMLAVQGQLLEVAQFLIKQPTIDIDACIDPNLELLQKNPFHPLNMNEEFIKQTKECKGLSTLCYAAINGNDAIVQLLLDNGAALYNSTRTPLILAIQNEHYALAKKIVAHSPQNINDACTMAGINALYVAITAKRKDIVEYLLDNGAQVNRCCMSLANMSPLLAAIETSDLELVKLLVEKGADINYQAVVNDMIITVCRLAIMRENQPIIDFLISQPNIIIR